MVVFASVLYSDLSKFALLSSCSYFVLSLYPLFNLLHAFSHLTDIYYMSINVVEAHCYVIISNGQGHLEQRTNYSQSKSVQFSLVGLRKPTKEHMAKASWFDEGLHGRKVLILIDYATLPALSDAIEL